VTSYEFRDCLLVILDHHKEIETDVQSFIQAKEFLKNDTLNSDSIYLKLNRIQNEISTLHSNFFLTSFVYGSTPPDEKLYAFHASPGDRLVNDAANEIIKYLLFENRIKESTAIDSWKETGFEQAGLNMLNYLDLEKANNVTLIEEEIINNNLATDVLKFTAAKLILEKQSLITYDRYAEIISGIENYVLQDFILLFNTEAHKKFILEKFSKEERMKLLEKLKFRKKNNSNKSTVSKLSEAIGFLQEE
jgi:hypothetical protein